MNCLSRFASPLERRIAKRLVNDILKRGYLVRVWDGECWAHKASTTDRREILDAMASTGCDTLCISRPDPAFGKLRIGSVTLIWGNDRDLISDWSDTVETNEIVNPLLEWIEGNDNL